MRSTWRFSLAQLLAGITALAVVLAAAVGHFGSVIQVLALAILIVVGLALLRWLTEIGVEAVVYGAAFGLKWLWGVVAMPLLWFTRGRNEVQARSTCPYTAGRSQQSPQPAKDRSGKERV